MPRLLETLLVIVLGVGHLVHPCGQVRAGLIPDLIGQRGVHRSLDRKPLSQIVSMPLTQDSKWWCGTILRQGHKRLTAMARPKLGRRRIE